MSNTNSSKVSRCALFKILGGDGQYSAHITISNPTDLAISVDTSGSGTTTSQLTIELAGEEFDKLAKNWVEMSSIED